MHERVREGDVLEVGMPKNHFALDETARHSLLLAGGIGITPLLAMAERLASLGHSFELHYCTRSVGRAAFLPRLREAGFAARVHLHHDDGAAQQKLDIAATLRAPAADRHLYVCGPNGFMDAVLGGARAAGWREPQLHSERFAAAPPGDAAAGSFVIRLARSGRELTVPADKSAAQVMLEAGVDLPLSCEQGVCGTCLTRVIEGLPDHRDAYLTPDEQALNDQFTPCCSRAKSAVLVIDR
jgi:vanillate O-demethylase ferredoxin subunit